MSTWRGDYKQIQDSGANIVAISTDQTFAQRVFKASLGGLPFELLSDWMRETARAYGVLDEKGGYAQRSTFVIDQNHHLLYQNLEFGAGNRSHYEAVLEVLKTYQGTNA